MVKKKTMNQVAYWSGALIVFGTHLMILVSGLPQEFMMPHAIINLFAGTLYAYAWFTK